MGTKGHWQRPTSVDEDEREMRWRLAFGLGAVKVGADPPAPNGGPAPATNLAAWCCGYCGEPNGDVEARECGFCGVPRDWEPTEDAAS